MQTAAVVASQRVDDDQAALDRAAEVFSVLGSSIRLAVLRRLLEREWSVNELAADVRLSQSALSQHLSKLRDANIVTVRRDQQTRFYRCDSQIVSKLLTELELTK